MPRASGGEYLAHSFTDLMTSLMVIFILLLLVFLNNQAGANAAVTEALRQDLRDKLEREGIGQEAAPKDPYTIALVIPNQVMTFETNRYELKPEGEEFLRRQAPKLAQILCGAYRGNVESVIVEGHSDSVPFRSASPEESQNLNLKLSQDRSMEVVKKTLQFLEAHPEERACLLEKLSATGRGEQDLESTADKSRRVVLKIRVNSGSVGSTLLQRFQNGLSR